MATTSESEIEIESVESAYDNYESDDEHDDSSVLPEDSDNMLPTGQLDAESESSSEKGMSDSDSDKDSSSSDSSAVVIEDDGVCINDVEWDVIESRATVNTQLLDGVENLAIEDRSYSTLTAGSSVEQNKRPSTSTAQSEGRLCQA